MPGTYTLRPIQANLTHDTDWLGKMDPYCSYRIGASRIKGPVCRNGGKFPKWEDATVNVPDPNDRSLVVDLMDKEKILFDDNIGTFVIDLQEIQNKGRISKWYPVYWHKKPAGEILMEAAFQPEIIQQPQPVIQQPIVMKEVVKPVIIEKKTVVIEKPVLQKPIIQEEVLPIPSEGTHHTSTQEDILKMGASQRVLEQDVLTTMPQQQIQSGGVIIQGVSQIHHGGVGHGLVPQPLSSGLNQNAIITESSKINYIPSQSTTLQQGSLGSGNIIQGGLTSGNLNQGNLMSSNLNQGTLGTTNFVQGSLINDSLDKSRLESSSFNLENSILNQGNLGSANLNQGNVGLSKFSQGNVLPSTINQGTMGSGSLNQGNLGSGNLNQNLGQGTL